MDKNLIQNATNNQVAKKQNATPTMKQLIKQYEKEIAKALPSVMTPERFARIATTALTNNPALNKCTQQSFIGALLQSAQLGLEPNTPLGQAYLIPYLNHGTYETQFQIGYKGMIDLAYRSEDISVVQAQIVYENDTFECEFGLEPKLKHIPADSNRGRPIKVYAMFKTKLGGFGFEVMSYEEVEEHAKKYSQAYKKGYTSPWITNFDEMAKKTVLKKCLKYAPLKSDYARALVSDETIKTEISDDMTEVEDKTIWIDDEEPKEEVATNE